MCCKLVAAIDGGGTKTVMVLADTEGVVHGIGRGGPINALFVPREEAVMSVQTASGEAVRTARQSLRSRDAAKVREGGQALRGTEFGGAAVSVSALYASAPGAGNDVIREGIAGMVEPASLQVEGDEQATFAGALASDSGIVVLAGTGSFAYGRAGDVAASAGGWGPLLGDEGSAYAIGLDALRAVAMASEGRGPYPDTILRRLALAQYGLDTERDLATAGLSRDAIAGFAVAVSQAAASGDPAAQGILRKAGEDLGRLAAHIAKQLPWASMDSSRGIPVALVGGAARAGAPLWEAFESTLRAAVPTCITTSARFSPAGGALLLALKMSGVELTEQLLKTIDRAAIIHPELKQ